jgi:hypothetical protein
MRRPFAALLHLYPPAYRDVFAEEMAAVFEESLSERRSRGLAKYWIFLITELSGLLQGAATAWAIGLWPRQAIPTVFPFLAGAIISAFILRPFVSIRHSFPVAEPHLYTKQEISALMAIVAISMVLVAGFSVAFVINMRMLARRRQATGCTARKEAFRCSSYGG